MKPIPENILSKMDPKDRPKGTAGMTRDECRKAVIARTEKELQLQISALLRRKGLYFDCDSMARKRVGTLGAPDFQFPYMGRFVAWEVKVIGGALSPVQAKVRDQIISQGGEWRLIRDLFQAQEHLKQIASQAQQADALNDPRR